MFAALKPASSDSGDWRTRLRGYADFGISITHSRQETKLQDRSRAQKGSLAPETYLATQFTYQIDRISSEIYVPERWN